jgi:hypothetical protein
MPQRKSCIAKIIFFSSVIFFPVIFVAGEREACAGTTDLSSFEQQRTEAGEQALPEKAQRFAIYLIKKPATQHEAARMSLEDLVLEEKPILTEDDISSYRISPDGKHIIRLKPGVTVRVAPPAGGTILGFGFVLVADGSRTYLGDFYSSISSMGPTGAWIQLPLARPGEAAELQRDIEISASPMRDFAGNSRGQDLRADPRIIEALQAIGKLDTKPNPDGWGESYMGIRARLSADKPVWIQGDAPSFKVEILNEGNNELHLIGANGCFIIIDGMIFKSSEDRDRVLLASGGRFESRVVLKPEIWRSQGNQLVLKPGKHSVRVEYALAGPSAMFLYVPSNTVEVEILPASVKMQTALPRTRFRQILQSAALINPALGF